MTAQLLAQVLPVDAPKISPALWDLLLIAGITGALAVIIFAVVGATRRSRKLRSRSRKGPEILKNSDEHIREQAERANGANAPDASPRKKRRRRDHRPRNPTLAEAGGLPPEREPGAAPHSGL